MNNSCTGIKYVLCFVPVHHVPASNLSAIRVLNSFNDEFFTHRNGNISHKSGLASSTIRARNSQKVNGEQQHLAESFHFSYF